MWFTASSAQGPWVVATSIPAAIYSIPPSSPLYYVTYVKIYDVTPQYVAVGYTPGYMGTVVTTDGVVVYGTGYNYVPYIGTTVWYLRLSPTAMQQIQPGLLGPGGPSASASAGPWAPRGVQAAAGAMRLRRTGGRCPMAVLFAVRMEAPQRGGPVVGRRPLAAFIRTGERPRRLAARLGRLQRMDRQCLGEQVGTSYNSVTGRVSAGQRAGYKTSTPATTPTGSGAPRTIRGLALPQGRLGNLRQRVHGPTADGQRGA